MTSVYAASVIHSKSTLSRKYDVDTSGMFGMANNWAERQGTEEATSGHLLQALSLDIGRFDYPHQWINYIRFIIMPLTTLCTAYGFLNMRPERLTGITRTFFTALQNIMLFVPDGSSLTLSLSVYLSFLIVYIVFVLFMIYLALKYKNGSCASTVQVYIWVTIGRIVMPFFTVFISSTFSRAVFLMIQGESDWTSISALVISLPLLLVQLIYMFVSCSVYNATPIIRAHDITQLWFAHSRVDWIVNIFISVNVFLQYIFKLADDVGCCLFFAFETVASIALIVLAARTLPFIHPVQNAFVVGVLLDCPFAGLVPLLSHYLPNIVGIYALCTIASFFICLVCGRLIVNHRIRTVLNNFAKLNQPDDDDEDSTIDPLSAAFMQPATDAVNFDKMGLSGEHALALHLRVGFLFNQQEVCNQSYIKWAISQNTRSSLILSACQVSYALMSDGRMLNTLEQLCQKLGSAAFNWRSFVVLFNHLRQELLTQLNQPLLQAINYTKNANRRLTEIMSEYWTAILKHKIKGSLGVLSNISHEMIKTDVLFQRLMRNYPRSPAVLREAVIFYHKSVGDHYKAVECQAMYNRMKNTQTTIDAVGDGSSSSTDAWNGIDNEFRDQMEPWLASQDVISRMRDPSMSCITAFLICCLIGTVILPLIVLILSLSRITFLTAVITPVQTIGDILYAVTRIPQLVRRRQLLVIGEVSPWIESTGPPLGTIQEFIELKNILPSVENYLNVLGNGTLAFMDICSSISELQDTCASALYETTVGNATSKTTLYGLLSSFTETASWIAADGEQFPWATANETTEVQFLFDNFDQLYQGLYDVLIILSSIILEYKNYFEDLTKTCFILLWVYPVVIVLPLCIWSYFVVRKNTRFVNRMFVQVPKSEILALKWACKTKPPSVQITGASIPTFTNENLTSTERDAQAEMASSLAIVSRMTYGTLGQFLGSVVLLLILSLGLSSIGVFVFRNSMAKITAVSNCLISAIEVYSSAVASYVWTQEVFAEYPLLSETQGKMASQKYITKFLSLYDGLLYGTDQEEVTAALLLGDEVINAYIVSGAVNSSNDEQITPVYGVLHDVYFSMSCDSQMRLFDELASFLLSLDADAMDFNFSATIVYHYEHLLFVHLLGFLRDGCALFSAMTDDLNHKKTDEIVLVFVVMFVLQFCFFCTVVLSKFLDLRHLVGMPRRLMLLVSPEALLKSQTIVKWLNGSITPNTRSHFHEQAEKCKGEQTEFVLEHSRYGVVLADDSITVSRATGGALTLFRCSNDEIVGTNFLDFLRDHLYDKNKASIIRLFEHHIRKMRDGHSKEKKVECSTAIMGPDDEVVFIAIILEGHSSDEDLTDRSGNQVPPADSFSFIVYNNSTERQQQKLIKIEKEKASNIVEAILPKQVCDLVSQPMDKGVAFDTARATVVFVKLVNWSELTSDQSPSETLSLLNDIYVEYEKVRVNFPQVVKVKIVREAVVFACGLFPDGNLNTAQTATDFCVQLLEAMDEFRKEQSKDVHILIGMATGGPVTCGKIGTVQFGFDIFGEVVSQGVHMLETGAPDVVHIAESTYDEIKFMNVNIQEVGESHRKRKGITKKTYFVSPTQSQFVIP